MQLSKKVNKYYYNRLSYNERSFIFRMGSIIKVTNGKGTHYKAVYELPPYVDGSRRRTSKTFPVGTTLQTVKKFLAEKEREKDIGSSLSLDYKLTFSQFADIYFNTYTKFLSASTYEGYTRAYTNKKAHGLRRYFGNVQLRKITQRDLQEYVNFLSSQVSPKSTKNYIMLLSVLFKLAVQQNIIPKESNPMQDIIKPRQRKKEVEAYNIDEFRLLLKLSSEDNNPHTKLIIHLALLSGIRRGEMAALLWNDIDFEHNCISINKSRLTVHGVDHIQPPKTDAGIRKIFVPERLMRVLKEYNVQYKMNRLRFGKDFIDSDYVITHPNGKPMTPQGVTNCYLRFMERNKDKIRYLKFHGLRHTYASLLIEQGENPKTVQHNLGHADVGLTLQIYAHSYESAQKNAAEKLNMIADLDNKIG